MTRALLIFGILMGTASLAQAHWTCWSRGHRIPLLVEWGEKTLVVGFRGRQCALTRVKYADDSPLYQKWWKFDNLNKQSATYRTICQNVGTPLFSKNMTEEIDLHWIKVSRSLLDSQNGTIHIGFEKPGTSDTTDAFFYCSQ